MKKGLQITFPPIGCLDNAGSCKFSEEVQDAKVEIRVEDGGAAMMATIWPKSGLGIELKSYGDETSEDSHAQLKALLGKTIRIIIQTID